MVKVFCVIVTLLSFGLFTGCNQPVTVTNQQLQAITQLGVNHLQVYQQMAEEECGDGVECPEAERYAEWVDVCNRFITYLEQPIPAGDREFLMFAVDVFIKELEANSADPELLMYARDAKILIELILPSPVVTDGVNEQPSD
jgi:hypothetical protein